MGRPPRMQEPDLHYHVIMRCNNGAFRFESDEDFALFLNILRSIKAKHPFQLFNYELMHSHVHLFLQPSPTISLEKTMHLINWTFARVYNKQKNRKGHFWLDRYKSIPVDTDLYALALMRYINRNAVRAGIVAAPEDWRWSGYRFYAMGEQNLLLEFHPSFLALSSKAHVRQTAYEEYVKFNMPGDESRKPEFSDNKYIGSDSFGQRLGLSTSQK